MKKLALVTFSMVLFGLMATSIGQEAFKLGVVDTQRVLQNYKKAIEADKILKTGEKNLKETLDPIIADIRNLEEKKAKTELFVEKAQTDDLEKQIRSKQDQFVQEQRAGEQALFEKRQELLVPILKELEDLIIKIGKEEKYDLIISKQAALYYDEKYDITDKLIELINAGADKAEPKEEEAKKPEVPVGE